MGAKQEAHEIEMNKFVEIPDKECPEKNQENQVRWKNNPKLGYCYPCRNCEACNIRNRQKKRNPDRNVGIEFHDVLTSAVTGYSENLKKRLSCNDSGLYLLQCRQPHCNEQMLFFTKTKTFAQAVIAENLKFRENIHKLFNKEPVDKNNLLIAHYKDQHGSCITSKNFNLFDAFTVILLDTNLDNIAEWTQFIKPSIYKPCQTLQTRLAIRSVSRRKQIQDLEENLNLVYKKQNLENFFWSFSLPCQGCLACQKTDEDQVNLLVNPERLFLSAV